VTAEDCVHRPGIEDSDRSRTLFPIEKLNLGSRMQAPHRVYGAIRQARGVVNCRQLNAHEIGFISARDIVNKRGLNVPLSYCALYVVEI